MQTTSRPRDTGASFAARRGHIPQLSISDDNHHVTEAIGYMYGDEPENPPRRITSPLSSSDEHATSFQGGSLSQNRSAEGNFAARRTSIPRKQLPERQMSNGSVIIGPNANMRPHPGKMNSWERQNGSPSPPMVSRERTPSDTATSHFPLNDIDYESSPAAVAQELSNLQALRRMSMDVGAAMDPDLPQLNAAAMPNAPSSSASEDDSSRLFWVPARLHPELAPKEFKTFLDSKAEQIKRRSGELSSFGSPMASRSSSLSVEDHGGLHRKKSMLSRQIDTSVGYQDGADRLERKKSLSQRAGPSDPNLQELESLVSNPEDLKRLSLDTAGTDESGDVILPSVPGSSLKRSTRTTYRRGGSVKGRADRSTYAQRASRRSGGEIPMSSPVPDVPPLPNFASSDVTNLASTLKDPSIANPAGSERRTYNFSRPATAGRTPSPPSNDYSSSIPISFDSILTQNDTARLSTNSMPDYRRRDALTESYSLGQPSTDRQHIPQIIEVPPPEESVPTRPSTAPNQGSPMEPPVRHPERRSSREDRAKTQTPQRPSMPPKQSASVGPPPRPPSRGSSMPPQTKPTQSLEQPSPLPGNDTNTSNLSFIPTLTVDKRADHKPKEESKKSGWGWLLGKEDSSKDKPEKPKAKISKPPQSHDNTRLDVLQTSIDGGGKGRESLVLDRDGVKLDEERKKESARKSSGVEAKKEKEGLFSSFFGAGKKAKADKEASKKHRDRGGLSPEPYRELKPDIDYNWTRFSILEERAIYRMAHIKLANPRRALYSQVLLSNFMYSYLAKVQQMHPQMNLPTSAKQQRKQQQKETQQPDEFTQYQRYQQQQQAPPTGQQPQPQPGAQAVQPVNQSQYNQQQEYDGDSSTYDYEAGSQRPSSRGSKQSVDSNGSAYSGGYNQSHPNQQQQQSLNNHYGAQADDDDDDMW